MASRKRNPSSPAEKNPARSGHAAITRAEGKILEFAMVIEKETGGYSASFPDGPGCFTQGDSLVELMDNARDALEGHLAGLKALGKPIPKPRHRVTSVFIHPPGQKAG